MPDEAPPTLKPQPALTKRIFDYLRAEYDDSPQFRIISDQGKKWKAPKGSDARTGASFYIEGLKGRDTWMTRADVAVVDERRFLVPYIVEVEAGKYIKPKIPTGLIGTTNMCTSHYRSNDYVTEYELIGAVLFVVLCSPSFGERNSKKRIQLDELRKNYRVVEGCLASWHICEGATVDEAFDAFTKSFKAIVESQRATNAGPE